VVLLEHRAQLVFSTLAAAYNGLIANPLFTGVLGSDWGFCHTFERNLASVADLWATEPVPGASFDVGAQAVEIRNAIEHAPKSFGWRSRARIGERVRWYETPEEVRH